MVARVLPGTTLRVRRGRRQDLLRLQAVLRLPDDETRRRGFRRLLADLGRDVYVAEAPGGAIVGVVSVIYARSLARGGLVATLDGACAAAEQPGSLLAALIAFAEERARRRGCRRLLVPLDGGDETLRTALLARGYRSGEALTTELTEGSEAGRWR